MSIQLLVHFISIIPGKPVVFSNVQFFFTDWEVDIKSYICVWGLLHFPSYIELLGLTTMQHYLNFKGCLPPNTA